MHKIEEWLFQWEAWRVSDLRKIEKILESIREKLLRDEVSNYVTGELSLNLVTGGVSGPATLKVKL